MKKREIAIYLIGIILIIGLAFLVANFINENNKKSINGDKKSEVKEKLKIDGKEIDFKTYRVDKSFFLRVPDNFIVLDEETLKNQYNYNNRPELVFTSTDNLVHIFISTTNLDMTDDLLEEYVNGLITTAGNIDVKDVGTYYKHDKTFAKLTFISNDTNGTYYTVRYFVLDDKLVTVEFNATSDVYEKWIEVSNEVMDSICFKEDEF